MNMMPMTVAVLAAAPFIVGWIVGHKECVRPAVPARQSDLDPVVELILRFSEERSVERREQILSLLASIDRQRASLRFLATLANDCSLLPSLRRKAISILLDWDSLGAMRAAEAIVDGHFDRSAR